MSVRPSRRLVLAFSLVILSAACSEVATTPECTAADASACDDGDACTTDTCSAAGTCVHEALTAACRVDGVCYPEGAPSPSDACRVCDASTGSWVGAVCDDGNPCTHDTCDPVGGCRAVPDDAASCSDGNACTQVDRCSAGACVGSQEVVCMASGACREVGTCDPGTGLCSDPPSPDHTACSDGDGCTQGDSCISGVCTAETVTCPGDGLSCTDTQCVSTGIETFTCSSVPRPGFCILGGACFSSGGANPGNPCELCDPERSQYAWVAQDEGGPCGPVPDKCEVQDTCDGAGVCRDNGLLAAGQICRPALGQCDLVEHCDGSSATCPADLKRTDACRPALDGCDVGESCDGVTNDCPTDRFASQGTDCGSCRSCNGSGVCAPNSTDHEDCGLCSMCASGVCAPAPTGSDPKAECPVVDCTQYTWGWSGSSCMRFAPGPGGGSCNGAGACEAPLTGCTDMGSALVTCGDTGCVRACLRGDSVANYDTLAEVCWQDWAQHNCATGYWCGPGATCQPKAPPAPRLVAEPDVLGSVPTTVTLEWLPVSDPNGHPVEYTAQIDTDPLFGSVDQTRAYGDTTFWTVTVPAGTAIFWRAMTRNQLHPTVVSPWSAVDEFAVMSSAPPPTPVLIPQPDFNSGGASLTTHVLAWNPVLDPNGDPVEYRVMVDDTNTFTSPAGDSGWISTTSWAVSLPAPDYTWYWRVRARDANHHEAASDWSAIGSFSDLFVADSCPYVFSWNGTGYDYVTDLQGPVLGLPAGSIGSRMVQLYQPHHVVLEDLVPVQGEYLVKIRETLPEISYLDELKLLVVDHPPGYELTTTTAASTYQFGYADPFRIWTFRDPVRPTAAVDDDGRDVLAELYTRDGIPAPVEEDADEFYELDFPRLARPEHAKLVIDGWSIYGPRLRWGTTQQGWVEILDQSGAWTEVAKIPPPAGDEKAVVVDLSHVYPVEILAVRIHLGWRSGARWVVDRVRLDDSAPVALTVTEVSASAADLAYRGMLTHQRATLIRRISALDDVLPDPVLPGTGAFTRFGDVAPLLLHEDDMFVIMGSGDEVALRFPEPPPAGPGLSRTVLLHSKLYYKENSVLSVEPLPFSAMSSYPYDPALESYPSDPEHDQYRALYNTRVH